MSYSMLENVATVNLVCIRLHSSNREVQRNCVIAFAFPEGQNV